MFVFYQTATTAVMAQKPVDLAVTLRRFNQRFSNGTAVTVATGDHSLATVAHDTSVSSSSKVYVGMGNHTLTDVASHYKLSDDTAVTVAMGDHKLTSVAYSTDLYDQSAVKVGFEPEMFLRTISIQAKILRDDNTRVEIKVGNHKLTEVE